MKKLYTILIAMILGITAFSQIPTNGLVGYWPFNGNASDESGSNHNGTVTGATLTSDRFGNAISAYSFNGINNFIQIANSNLINLSTDFSISCWININDGSGISTVISKSPTNSWLSGSKSIELNTNKIAFDSYGQGNPYINYTLTNGTWYHIVCTHITSPDTIDFYINDIKYNLSLNYYPSLVNPDNSSDVICFAKHGSGFYFDGIIDDIRIYNRVLNQSEISELYNENICYQTITVTDTLIINANLTGYNPVTYANTIKIYPNPTKDHIYIKTDNNNSIGYQVKIINTLSQIVYQTTIIQTQYYIDLNTWSGNGTYFVQLYDTNGNLLEVRKIIIQ